MIVQNYRCTACGERVIRPDVRGRRLKNCGECGRHETLEYQGKSHNGDPVPDAPKPDPKPDAPKPAPMPEGARLPGLPDLRHYALERAALEVKAGNHVYAFGPSGSGKSYGARQIAGYFDLPITVKSCHVNMTEESIMGYMDARGNYVKGLAYDRVKDGGVLMLDEVDASSPDLLVALNNLLALEPGDCITFPNGEDVAIHESFRVICGGNTAATGADENYTGRQPLDMSFHTRVAFIEWNYDESLERKIGAADPKWTRNVQAIRKAVARAGAELPPVSPRAIVNGIRGMAAGLTWDEVMDSHVWKGANEDTRRSVLAYV